MTITILCLGIDISSEAINNARARISDNKLLDFEESNLNDLQILKNMIVFFYYLNNIKKYQSST